MQHQPYIISRRHETIIFGQAHTADGTGRCGDAAADGDERDDFAELGFVKWPWLSSIMGAEWQEAKQDGITVQQEPIISRAFSEIDRLPKTANPCYALIRSEEARVGVAMATL